jgi:hypothetical protein
MSSTRACASLRDGAGLSGIAFGAQQALAVAGDIVEWRHKPVSTPYCC